MQPRFTPLCPGTADTESHLFLPKGQRSTSTLDRTAWHGHGPRSLHPKGLSPPSLCSPFSPLPCAEARAAPWLPRRWVYPLHRRPAFMRESFEDKRGLREWGFKAQAAVAGDAIPGLPSTVGSEPQAGWPTVLPAHFGVDLCMLPVPRVEEKPPSYNRVSKQTPSSLELGPPAKASRPFQNPP